MSVHSCISLCRIAPLSLILACDPFLAKLPAPIKNRDFLVQRQWKVEGDYDDVAIKIKSVTFPVSKLYCYVLEEVKRWKLTSVFVFALFLLLPQTCPEKKDFVRANTLLAGYYIQRISSGCILTYVAQTDPKGSLPAYFVNKLVTKLAPSILSNLREICNNYPEWKKKHKPDFKPWKNPEQNSLPFIDVESQSVVEKSIHPFLKGENEDIEDDAEMANAPHFGLEDLED